METATKKYSSGGPRGAALFNACLCFSIALVLSAFEWSFPVMDIRMFSEEDLEVWQDDVLFPQLALELPKPPPLVNPIIKEVIDDIEVPDVETVFAMEDAVDLPAMPTLELPVKEVSDEILDFTEVMPEPIGGMSLWHQYLAKQLKYPKQAVRAGVEGTVFVSFVVNKDGSIQDITILRGIGMGCDEEALRVISQAPKWSPGKQGGKPIRVRMRMPIRFKLN
jgi:periplasmic protein TonB